MACLRPHKVGVGGPAAPHSAQADGYAQAGGYAGTAEAAMAPAVMFWKATLALARLLASRLEKYAPLGAASAAAARPVMVRPLTAKRAAPAAVSLGGPRTLR